MNFIKIIKFDLMNILRNRMLLVINTIFPLILMGIMGFVTNSSFGGGMISSYDFYGVTTMIFVGLLISMTATNTFMEEKVKKGNSRIVYAPVSKTEIYLSKLLATYILGTISYSTICLIGQYIFHLNFGGKNILFIIVLINILELFGCSLGTLCCCIFRSEEGANAVVPLVTLLFVFFGGIFSPVGHFGKLLQKIANLSPVNWVTKCSFRIIYDNDFSIYLPTLFILILASIICIIICQIIFRPEEYV